PQPSDMTAAPVPDKAAAQVKSVFSDSYASVTPGLVMGGWGQSTTGDVVSISGNNAYKFTNFNYLGLQVSSNNDVVDMSDMKYIHIDLYAETEMDLNFFPISLNPTVDSAKATLQLTAGEWRSFDFPMSDFSGVDFTNFGQVKFDGGNGQTFYLDNLYFWTDGSVTPIDPDPIVPDPIVPDPSDTPSASPAPVHEAPMVMSFYSDAYPTIVPDLFVGTWGQSTVHEYVDCEGDQALKLTNFNYLGLQFSHSDDVVALTNMTHLHLDLYATHETIVEVYPISLNPTVDTDKVVLTVAPGEWISHNLSIDNFPNVNFSSLGQFKFVNVTPAAASVRARVGEASEPALYLDNLYAWNNSTTGIDSVAAGADRTPGVYDLFGRKLRENNSLDGLPRGLYIVGGRKTAVTR
ncbi:MAG: hypothetical protein K2L96_00195, partial [Muribaculaceae bacterium]|nr:hypothetical protein [Muribaculaceae bacterium]